MPHLIHASTPKPNSQFSIINSQLSIMNPILLFARNGFRYNHYKFFLDDTFLVISGDAITDFDLANGIRFHQEKDADATLIMAREEIPLEYGVVMTDEQGEIVRFLEKPDWGQVFSDTINTGIYVLNPSIFELYNRGVKFDFSKELFPLMLKEKKRLFGITLDGYWNDIGSLKEYYLTQFDLLEGRINLPISATRLDDQIWVEEDVEISDQTRLKGPLYLGKGTMIARGVRLENSVIGRNCELHPYASIKRSILWDNNNIGGAILASNVTLQDRVAVFDQTAIGKKVFIGSESRIKPGNKVWPERKIGSRIEVDRNVIWPEYWSNHLFNHRGISGQSNIEITPEFVANLGTAYATTLNRGNEIIVGSDNYSISNALKKTLTGSLQAAGINIVDIGENTTAVTRFSIVKLSARSGAHIRVSSHDPQMVIIEFMNKEGMDLSVGEQKGIERRFFSEDYNRTTLNEVGDYTYAPEMVRDYLDDLLVRVDQDVIKKNYFSVVVDYEYDSLGNILPLFLRRLNCQLVSTKNYSQEKLPLSIEKRLKTSKRVARIMNDHHSDLGIIIDHDGEFLYLVNRKGEVLSRARYQLLISYILLKKGLRELYLPYNSPRVIESLAKEYGAEIYYMPINSHLSMDKYYNDGITGLVLILEEMGKENINLDQLLDHLPEFYLNNAEVPCDWENKGRIMRCLSEDADQDVELIDGIKFNHSQGWALIVPDNEKPLFHIYAEGEDLETAESLTGFYLNRVRELVNDHNNLN